MKLPKTLLMELLGYKWLLWIVLTTAVFSSVSIGSRANLGTTPESQFPDSSWCFVILGVWYTATPLSNNPPVWEETKVYGSTTQVTKPQVFRSLALAFLLCYLGAYFFLGRFNPLLGRYQLLGELFHLGMVSLPVGSLVTGLNASAIIHRLGSLLPSGWVPDTGAFQKETKECNLELEPEIEESQMGVSFTLPGEGTSITSYDGISGIIQTKETSMLL
ncbi:hypothetical protein DSO57_1009652 [Entomophthora muscae]|uniref:Uncharacterized protein n=1 Tax=Entomophthora muscae TaxID=34485 RepID=A0ACC2SVU6_9FUNG|nr:hypothetical protein DSO57_1009652 [Entomophthora muscae]